MTSTIAENAQPIEQRLLLTIENWKRKLLDVSKRNRSLNFKPLRVSTITIVDTAPDIVFSKLWIDGSNMRFAAAEKSSDSPDDDSNDIVNELQPSDFQQPELLLSTDPSQQISDQTHYTE
jgi:hypothetical protein